MAKSLKISNFIVYQTIKMYMNISDSLDQYADICRDAIKKSSAKLNKRFENLLVEIMLLYMIIPRKINFTQMERYGRHCEQTYRSNFNRKKSECINWLLFNLSLAKRSLDMDGLLAVAIDPCYISKAGRKTAHIGTFWSGCAGSMKHGLEIMGLGLVDVMANTCMMLRAHQTPGMSELKQRNKTLVQHYTGVIKRYSKELVKVTDIVVADAYFSTSTFVDGIAEFGFHLVSRFRDNADLRYLYTGPRTGKRGRPRLIDGKIDYESLDHSRMEKLHIEGLEGKAYTLLAYSKAMKRKVRFVIWIMPNNKHKIFFSTKLTMTGEEVLRPYRSRFQIEFRLVETRYCLTG